MKTIANNLTASSPSWSVVIQLVRALVLPRVTYGMPVFAPTAAQSGKLATIIARGLYLMLEVKDNPSTMAVLVDNALLSPEFDFPLLALRYANRLYNAQAARNPAADTLARQLRSPLSNSHAHSIARAVRAAEVNLKAKHDVPRIDKKKTREQALRNQRATAAQPRAAGSDMPQNSNALFLQLLGRKAASVLALFRYNRVKLNHITASKGGGSADCPFCPGVTETLRHALLVCPKYAAPRAECQQALRAMYVVFSYTVLLGAVDAHHVDRSKRALLRIVHYLCKVREIRRV
jgi:CTP:molybdopterin cytidylyltransferase MocA